jgi:hypothetical protein
MGLASTTAAAEVYNHGAKYGKYLRDHSLVHKRDTSGSTIPTVLPTKIG